MKKRVICSLCAFLMVVAMFACAETEDASWLDADCPFEVRNGIKFGMSLEEVEAIEGVELIKGEYDDTYTYPSTVELGGLEGYVIEYSFVEERLYKLEYLFEFPETWNMEEALAGRGSNDCLIWIDNMSTLLEAMTSKYGDYSRDVSPVEGLGSIWNIAYDYDVSLVGVDITVVMDFNPYVETSSGSTGAFLRNRVTYEAHNYQADIDAQIAEQEFIQQVADGL